MSKNPIDDNSVQATMIVPLWGRAKYSQLYPDLLNDPSAQDVLSQLNRDFEYDLSIIEEYHKDRAEYFGLIFLARARNFDDVLSNYLQTHPKATVVSMGSGLDTTFSRMDNGHILWYDIDLPNVIDLRKKYIPETDRSKCIAKSVLDLSWIKDIEYTPEQGIFFIAGGLFIYFKEDEVKKLLITLADSYPKGEIIFDGASKLSLKVGNKRTKKVGKTKMLWHFFLKSPNKQINRWSPKLQVCDFFPYWAHTPRNPKWSKTSLKLMKISTFLKLGLFAHVKFLK